MPPDTIGDVVEDLRAFARLAEPDDGTGLTIRPDRPAFNDADLIAPIVIPKNRRPTVQPFRAHRTRIQRQNFFTEPSRHRGFRCKRQFDRARLDIGASDFGHPRQPVRGAGHDVPGGQAAGLIRTGPVRGACANNLGDRRWCAFGLLSH
nr:hypothetical protein [uncultured Paracoccus sp.]